MSRYALLLTTLLASFVTLDAAPAFAQSEAENRVAARALFEAGAKLQDEGKCDAAIEKFEAARRQFDAPTILLRIAQCQAVLKRLVLSAETYRAVIRWPAKDSDPPQFKQARDQAVGELAQIEPRIPKLTVEVSPRVSGLQVQLDGTLMDAAFIGVARPMDPATIRVVAFAPGYATTEKTVSLTERQSATVKLTLTTTGGAVVAPVIVPSGGTPSNPPQLPGGTTPATTPGTAPGATPATTPATTPPATTDPQPSSSYTEPKPYPKQAIVLEARLGWLFPSGVVPLPNGDKNNVTTLAKSAASFGLSAGARFDKLMFGLQYEGSSLSRGTDAKAGSSPSTHLIGLYGGYLTKVDQFGFYLSGAIGYRLFNVAWQPAANPAVGADLNYGGAELRLGAGPSIALSKSLRLIIEATFSGGTYKAPKIDGIANTNTSILNDDSAFHMFWGLNAGIQFDAVSLSK